MINPYIGSKNPRNHTKTRNQPETKKIDELKYIFLGNLKVKKHLSEPSLTKWNLLTLRSTILFARISVNDDFLSLTLKCSDFLSYLFNQLRTRK
jgi:hypothetical protein